MLLNFTFNVLGRIRQKDGRVGITTAHFTLCSLEGWEELRVDQRWLSCRLDDGRDDHHANDDADDVEEDAEDEGDE